MMRKERAQLSIRSGFLDRSSQLFEKYHNLLLSTILFLALFIRVAALLNLRESIYSDYLLWDERIYHAWATKIAQGVFDSSSVYEFSPLPAYIMALVYKIFSPNIEFIRILNILFGVLSCYIIYLIGKEIGSRSTALFACLIAALYKPFIFYSIVPLKTSLSIFLFALTVYFTLSILNKTSMSKVFFLGIAAGLALNVRGNFIILFPLGLLIIFLNTCKDKAFLKICTTNIFLYVMGFLIAIAPFMARNYLVSGEFALTTSQAGFNLYLGNNLENPFPYYQPAPFASSSPFQQGVQFTIEASRRTNKTLSPQEASSYWTYEVIKKGLEQPAIFAWKVFQKTIVLFNRFEAGDHYHLGFISDFIRIFKLPFLSFWLIMPLGVAGMAISGFRSKKSMALGSIFLLYLLTLVIFYTNTRLRLPVLTILIPYTAFGINKMLSYITDRQLKMISIYFVIAMVFFAVEFLPVRGTGDMTAYYNTHALILDSRGRNDEAIEYWQKSSRANAQYSAYANLSLAGQYYRRGNSKKATYYLNAISDHSFAAASKYEFIGDIMTNQGEVEKAIMAYDKSLEINSGQLKTRRKLIKLLESIDKQRAFKEYEKLNYVASFYTIL
jgi:4-amino-4-deoxy-L-arabinose transferase-like glycosyltransferase